MGPIQIIGVGKAVHATRCLPQVYHLLPTYSVLSSNWRQSERSHPAAGEACIATSIGDASDAGAKAGHRHPT
jgi:hypothetical protein